MNTERELTIPVGKLCDGAFAVPEHDYIVFYFVGAPAISIRVIGGRLAWEAHEETLH